jgi:hypothetical protein
VALHVDSREPWWSSGDLERLDHEAAGLSIAVVEGERASRGHVVHVHSGEGLGERKDSGVLFQNQSHR